jgi:hypothetical protein
MPRSVNDAGVVVGDCDMQAAMWMLQGDSLAVVALEGLRGQIGSVATATNNLGDIVGYSLMPDFSQIAVLYNGPRGALDLTTLGFPALPNDINDSRTIVGGRVEDLGTPPIEFLGLELLAINERGSAAGFGKLPTSNPEDTLAVRFTDGIGWETPDTQPGAFHKAWDINAYGDLVISPPARLYTDAFGVVNLDGIVQARTGVETWVFPPDGGMAINDCGQIALIGNNLSSGLYGAVILKQVGFTLIGDLNGDGLVGQEDLGLLLAYYGTETPVSAKMGDLDGDLDVDQADLGILLANLGRSCPK